MSTDSPAQPSARVPVTVVSTGVANLASMLAALRNAGADPVVVDDARRVLEAEHVVLPGVGAFGAAMERLREHGLGDAVVQRIRQNRPTLCVCVGLQVLAASSDESPGVHGLGIFAEHVHRFPEDVRVPQHGWNRVQADAACQTLGTYVRALAVAPLRHVARSPAPPPRTCRPAASYTSPTRSRSAPCRPAGTA